MTIWPAGGRRRPTKHETSSAGWPLAMMNAVSGIIQLLLVLGLGGITLFPLPPAIADVFCDNLKQVAATLPNNTASSPLHFATTVFGRAPDVVYALAFCRGDVVNDTSCGECVATTFDTINKTITPAQQLQCYQAAYYYGGGCSLVYSLDDILSPSSNTTDGNNNGDDTPFARSNQKNWDNGGNWSTTNITGDADYVALTVGLLNELLVRTVQTAASTTPGRFTTGVMNSPTIVFYSMAQCTPDLSDSKCLACLTRLLGTLNISMTLRMGGQLHVIRCFFRYEAYRFFDSDPILHLGRTSAPAPATAPVKHKRRLSNFWIILIVVLPPAAAAFLYFIFCCPLPRTYRKGKVQRLQAGSRRTWDLQGEDELAWQGKSSEFSVFEFEQLLQATNSFSEENKLGQGGFGAVYKGQFPHGLEIAVKRLSSHSGQGFVEFKNEVQLIAKLQHRNLVRLLGCCSQEEEKILVYEYLPNKSLDFFIFDENRRPLLDWNKRIEIIEGIAHGLLYLHKHSRLRVIHRDLKPSNILLDSEMNPKISDFGLAKIFTSNNTEESTTRRVVGTYGYMSPEYACEGLFSIKSDVFSFGVLVLEILGGKRNSAGSHDYGDFINLLGYAWKLYEEERWAELMDASLDTIRHSEEMMRCMNIALLCVQEKAADRPTMSDVVAMLGNKSMVLVKPKHPAYFNLSSLGNEETSTATQPSSINDVTISVTTTGR